MFRNDNESHTHSLEILNRLYEYDDFMLSIKTVVDLGCGAGIDIEWWATRTTPDEAARPLNITCVGVDIVDNLLVAKKYPNVTYQKINFEDNISTPADKFDILWCHNSFQYCVNPLDTLKKWRDIASDGAMLVLSIPQTTNIHQRDLDFSQQDGCYYHYTIVNLIHMLAATGWNCRTGFFKKLPSDPWIHAIVYKSDKEPSDPRTTRWYDLVDNGVLPESAEKSIKTTGFLQQKDLVLPWIDRSIHWFGQQ